MLNIGEDSFKGGNILNKIYIPPDLIPKSGFGELRIIIEDGKIVDCKITTSIKLFKKFHLKKE